MRIAVHGVGASGVRIVRQLVDAAEVDHVVLSGGRGDRIAQLADSLHGAGTAADDPLTQSIDGIVLAGPVGSHVEAARRALEAGIPVVSTSDAPDDIEALLSLDAEARERSLTVAIGAAFSPGMSCALAALGAKRFDHVDEIHVSRVGTGGPSCARQHHEALSGTALDWRDGGWQERRAGSGRELSWFPDPIGARDCYRAQLGDVLLLVDAFPGAERVTARLAANRRDRLTAHLPMVGSPPAEGGPGAIRVEIRGRKGTATDVDVYGAIDRPSVATGAVAAQTIRALVRGDALRHGAAGIASLFEPGPLLRSLAAAGVKAAVFEGG